ncbi:MAG: GumC family protein [Cecembia sp.]
MENSLNFLKPFIRGWIIILAAMIAAYIVSSKYLNYVTPMYESTAKLRLADLNEGVPNSNLFKDLDIFATTQKINAEIELLKSYSLISKALEKVSFDVQIFRSGSIRKTELFFDSPLIVKPLDWKEVQKDKNYQLKIDHNLNLSITDEKGQVFTGQLGDTLNIEHSILLIELNENLIKDRKNLQITDDYIFTVVSKTKQINQINSNIDIIAVDKDVPVIRISFKSSNPNKAAIFPNALAETYIEDYIDNKYGAANITVDFLEERILEIGEKLNKAEKMILDYRDQRNITNIRQETETDLRKISQLKIQQTNLKMSLEAIKDLENYIISGKENFLTLAPNFEAFTDLLSTEIVKKIKQLQAEKKDLLLNYTDKDEKVMIVDDKINDLTSYLEESIRNTRKNLQTKYDKLNHDIIEAEKTFLDVPEKERMMTILNREFEIFQQSYNFLNQKKIEAEIAKAAKIAFHRIITPATVSKEPVSPNKIIIKLVSTILGMMAALILIFIIHTLKGRVNDLNTIESNSMIPVAALIPKLKSEQEEEETFLKILSDWEVKKIINSKQISCFTGFDQRHACAYISEQFAKYLSLQKRKVLLIQILHPSNTAQFISKGKIRISDNLDRVAVDPASLKKLTVEKWKQIIKRMASEYDQTIIINSDFGQTFTFATMAGSDLNIVCLDSRLTPAKNIIGVDLAQEEYKFPKIYFALNRVHYNPSLLKEILQYVKVMLSKTLTLWAK